MSSNLNPAAAAAPAPIAVEAEKSVDFFEQIAQSSIAKTLTALVSRVALWIFKGVAGEKICDHFGDKEFANGIKIGQAAEGFFSRVTELAEDYLPPIVEPLPENINRYMIDGLTRFQSKGNEVKLKKAEEEAASDKKKVEEEKDAVIAELKRQLAAAQK